MRSRRVPRGVGGAVGGLAQRLAPLSLLADVQRCWPEVAGEVVAREATPTAARAGVVTLTCSSGVWAQELELLGPDLARRLDAALGGGRVTGLRCVATPTRGWARGG